MLFIYLERHIGCHQVLSIIKESIACNWVLEVCTSDVFVRMYMYVLCFHRFFYDKNVDDVYLIS